MRIKDSLSKINFMNMRMNTFVLRCFFMHFQTVSPKMKESSKQNQVSPSFFSMESITSNKFGDSSADNLTESIRAKTAFKSSRSLSRVSAISPGDVI